MDGCVNVICVYRCDTCLAAEERERESDDVSFTSYTEKARISLLQPNVLKKTFLTLSEMARLELTRPFFMPCGWSALFFALLDLRHSPTVLLNTLPPQKKHTLHSSFTECPDGCTMDFTSSSKFLGSSDCSIVDSAIEFGHSFGTSEWTTVSIVWSCLTNGVAQSTHCQSRLFH